MLTNTFFNVNIIIYEVATDMSYSYIATIRLGSKYIA